MFTARVSPAVAFYLDALLDEQLDDGNMYRCISAFVSAWQWCIAVAVVCVERGCSAVLWTPVLTHQQSSTLTVLSLLSQDCHSHAGRCALFIDVVHRCLQFHTHVQVQAGYWAGTYTGQQLSGGAGMPCSSPVTTLNVGGYSLAFAAVCWYNYRKLESMRPPKSGERSSGKSGEAAPLIGSKV
jgi:hypothetical protein